MSFIQQAYMNQLYLQPHQCGVFVELSVASTLGEINLISTKFVLKMDKGERHEKFRRVPPITEISKHIITLEIPPIDPL